MAYSALLQDLIDAFRCLPGVGPKSAQRMAFHLLQRDREGGASLAKQLTSAINELGHCQNCRMFTEQPLCNICTSSKRDQTLLCVVETPADVAAIEQSGSFNGLYFILMGHLSPLDGIGPEDLGLSQLERRLEKGDVAEIIVATSSTVEGETTAQYLADMAATKHINASRIAYGVPMGGELEFVDSGTLSHALTGRRQLVD